MRVKLVMSSRTEGRNDKAVSIGSGYPGDPATKAFLESSKHPLFGWGGHVRFSWSTAARALSVEEGGVAFAWEDDDDEAVLVVRTSEHVGGASADFAPM